VPIENHKPLGYLYPMNKPANPAHVREWTDAPDGDAPPVAGYDAWLEQDIAAGLADLKAGKTTPLADIRKEFGLE
jgi:hypothetical protein